MTNVGTDLLDVAAKYDKERGFTEDGNDMFTVNAYAVRVHGIEIFLSPS